MIVLAIFAAYILFSKNNPEWNKNNNFKRMKFYLAVANSSTFNNIKRRNTIKTLKKSLKEKIQKVLSYIEKNNESLQEEIGKNDGKKTLKMAIL